MRDCASLCGENHPGIRTFLSSRHKRLGNQPAKGNMHYLFPGPSRRGIQLNTWFPEVWKAPSRSQEVYLVCIYVYFLVFSFSLGGFCFFRLTSLGFFLSFSWRFLGFSGIKDFMQVNKSLGCFASVSGGYFVRSGAFRGRRSLLWCSGCYFCLFFNGKESMWKAEELSLSLLRCLFYAAAAAASYVKEVTEEE